MKSNRVMLLMFLLVVAALSGGCGILALPVALPHALASNHPIDVKVRFIDETGAACKDVEAIAEVYRLRWNPIVIEDVQVQQETFHPVDTLQLTRKDVWLIFLYAKKPGYYVSGLCIVPNSDKLPSHMVVPLSPTEWELKYSEFQSNNQNIRNAAAGPIDMVLHRVATTRP